MKKRVNLKAVLILIVSCALLGVGVHFAHGFQMKRNAHGLIEEAVRVEQEGKLPEAQKYLKQYLGLVPEDTDALVRYGILSDQLAKTPRARLKAFFLLEQVLRRDGQRDEVRRRVAKMATELGQFGDAKTHLNILVKASPEDAELMQLMGRCAAGERHPEEAADWYRKALKQAPDRVEVHVEYAALLRGRLDQAALADDYIGIMIRNNESSPKARVEGARYFRRYGFLDQAEEHVRFAMEKLGADDADVLLLAADVAQARGKNAAARAYVERGRERYPKDTRLAQALARMELQDGDRQRALRHLEESLENQPTEPDQLWGLAGLFLEAGNLDQAEKLSKQLGQQGAVEAMRCLQAQILMRREAWAEARRTLEQVRAGGHLSPALARQVHYLLAVCYERLGNPDQRLAAYQRAVEADPQWTAARSGLARSLAALGKTAQAIKQYRQLVSQAPELRSELAQLLMDQNRRRPAAQRRWDEIDKLLTEAAADVEPSPEVVILRAQWLAAQDRLPEARKWLEAERQRDPKQVGPWLFLTGLAMREGKGEGVLPLLDEAEKQAGRRVEWSLARAGYWAQVGGADAPARLRKLQEEVKQFPEADGNRLLGGLAEAYRAVGDPAAAVSLWRQLAERRPQDVSLRLMLFERSLRPGQEDEARRLLAEVKGIEGAGGPVAAYGEAVLLIAQARKGDKKALGEARTLLALAGEQRPSWARVPLAQGETYELENRKDKALEKFQAALDRGEGRVVVIRRVVQLLNEQHRQAEAQALLAKLPERAMAIRELGQMSAALSLLGQTGDEAHDEESRDKALRQARKAAADNPKDYRDQVFLGQVAASVNLPEEAEKAFRRGLALDDTVPDTWSALILFLAPRDAKMAEAELKAAAARLKKEQLPPVLAAGYEALGRTKEAEEMYQAMLAAKPGDPALARHVVGFYMRTGQAAKAEPLLRQLIEPRTKAPQAAVAWARRELALGLAARGTYPAFEEALTLLDANARSGEDSLEDRQMKALVLATQPARRKEAISNFEKLTGPGRTRSPVAQFLLAQLYEQEGSWLQARTAFSALLQEQPKNPVFVGRYVRALWKHKDLDEAEAWVAKLAALAPRGFETIELRARLLKERGKLTEAGALVKAYAAEKDAQVLGAALLLDQLDQADAAETLYRSMAAASNRPEAALVLAQQLCRRRLPEALDLCEVAWKTCKPDMVAVTSVAILRAGKGNTAQYRRVESWLRTALVKHPGDPVVAVAYGEFQDGRGRHEEAVQLYRNALELSPDNVLALNNLAYLLAWKESKAAEALALAQRALLRAGPHPEMLDTRAVIYLKSGQADRALKDLNQAIALAPSAHMYLHLAWAQHLAKNRPAAAAAWRKAEEGGFQASELHALERPVYQMLAAALKGQ